MNLLFLSTLLLASALGLSACGDKSSEHAGHGDHGHGHEEDHAPEARHGHGHGDGRGETRHDEITKGPRGGRLLESGEFALEVTIFEDGVPPEFRLYPTAAGKPVPPSEVKVTMELARVNGLKGGKLDQHVFAPKNDYLLSPAEVYEPHSFDVKVEAMRQGHQYEWSYESPEGRAEIEPDMAAASDVKTARVAGGEIRQNLASYGSIQPNAERVRTVTARFPGIVKTVSVKVGDTVKSGQTLATIESNESLQVYAVAAPIAGTVTRRATNPGESAASEALFEVADFSTVWADLSVFPRDRARLKLGQTVEVEAADGAASDSGTVAYISPLGTATQALVARVVLDNASARWTPGQFVNAQIAVGAVAAQSVVPQSAVQTFRDRDVVFVTDGTHYQAQPVELGRRDAEQVEVIAGLEPGAQVVVGNSFLIKADIEKSGAAHDH